MQKGMQLLERDGRGGRLALPDVVELAVVQCLFHPAKCPAALGKSPLLSAEVSNKAGYQRLWQASFSIYKLCRCSSLPQLPPRLHCLLVPCGFQTLLSVMYLEAQEAMKPGQDPGK